MKLNPYLNFNEECEAALTFYAKVLGGKLDGLMRYGESPMSKDVPEQQHQLVMHAQISIGSQIIMGADALPQYCKNLGEGGGPIALTLNYDTAEQAERVFAALGEGGTVNMPIGPTFWAQRFGALTDKFGISWLINGALNHPQ